MEADHDLAMLQPLVASDRMLGRLGPTVEHVALGYRIRPCNIDYERQSFYASDQRALFARGLVVPVIV